MAKRGIILCMLLAGVAFGQSFLTPFDTSLLQLVGGGGGADIPRDGLVSEYLFTSDASDTSGNVYDGSANAGVTIAGTANFFTSGNGRISLGDNDFTTNSYTIAYWIKVDNHTRTQFVLTKDNGVGNRPIYNYFDFNNLNYYSDYNTNGVSCSFGGQSGVWTHVAITYNHDTGSLLLWENAVNASSDTITNPTENDAAILVGDSATSTAELEGEIDSLRFYNRTLTTDEIDALYNEGHD